MFIYILPINESMLDNMRNGKDTIIIVDEAQVINHQDTLILDRLFQTRIEPSLVLGATKISSLPSLS